MDTNEPNMKRCPFCEGTGEIVDGDYLDLGFSGCLEEIEEPKSKYTLHVITKTGCLPCVQLKNNLEYAGIFATYHESPCEYDNFIGTSRPAIIVEEESGAIVDSMYGCYSIKTLTTMANKYGLIKE